MVVALNTLYTVLQAQTIHISTQFLFSKKGDMQTKGVLSQRMVKTYISCLHQLTCFNTFNS